MTSIQNETGLRNTFLSEYYSSLRWSGTTLTLIVLSFTRWALTPKRNIHWLTLVSGTSKRSRSLKVCMGGEPKCLIDQLILIQADNSGEWTGWSSWSISKSTTDWFRSIRMSSKSVEHCAKTESPCMTTYNGLSRSSKASSLTTTGCSRIRKTNLNGQVRRTWKPSIANTWNAGRMQHLLRTQKLQVAMIVKRAWKPVSEERKPRL